MKKTLTVEIEIITRSGTIDYPYEDTWQETKEVDVEVTITEKTIALYMNPDFYSMNIESRKAYLTAINDMYYHANDFLYDWMEDDEDFQDYLKELAQEEYENNYK